MAKPTITPKNSKVTKNKSPFGGALIGKKLMAKVQNDKGFRDQCLTAYANRLLLKTGRSLDITYIKPVSDTMVSLAFDGKPSKSRYIVFPYKDPQSKKLVGAFKSVGQEKQ